MATASKHLSGKTRVSAYFGLDREQSTLDFVDVPIGNDTPVFFDPSRLRTMHGDWAAECTSLLQAYFECVLAKLEQGDSDSGTALLAALAERNEFHLGLSSDLSDGRAFGRGYAEKVWNALKRSKARRTGLLQDLEDASLFIDGIGPDRISDAVCNILRGPLIRYTQEMCAYYGIPMVQKVPSGPIWNPVAERWEDSFIPLPVTSFGPLILIPKAVVRHRLVYDSNQYYRHYLLPMMQLSEKTLNSALVHTLKSGKKKVHKKDLLKKYGADKLAIVEQTLRHPEAIQNFRQAAKKTSQPLSHDMLASVENIAGPRFTQLLDTVRNVPVGRDSASDYENAIEKLLSALFYPSLVHPRKQHEIHEGRKRIDITYVNSPTGGFFYWASTHYSSANIYVECKNYGKELANPEIDQLSGRFSPSRGQVGILVCRSIQNPELLQRRCADTARDGRGFIMTLTDDDLGTLVKEYIETNGGSGYSLLMRKFQALIS